MVPRNRRTSILLSLPISPPIKRYCQNTKFIHKTSGYEKRGFLWDARSICELRSKNETQCLNLMYKQTNGEHEFFVLAFSRQVMAVFIFFRVAVSVICIPRKNLKKQKGEFSVCWLVNDQYGVKKSHPTCNIERGIADQ